MRNDRTIHSRAVRRRHDRPRPHGGHCEGDRPWAGFLAMRERVDNPRRRIGSNVRRAGPVLFDPCQYLNRGEA
jgi:hypothetical protein